MKKRFKSKKRIINYKLILYITFIILSFISTFKLLINNNKNDHNKFITNLLNEGIKDNNFFLSALTKDSLKPVNMIYKEMNSLLLKENLSVFSNIETDSFDYNNEKSEHIKEENVGYIKNPLIYIYNTHQTEEYKPSNNLEHNIVPNVMMASYILREELKKKNISSMVESNNIKKYLETNNLNYDESYIASRFYINEAKNKYKTLKYFIDIHRSNNNIKDTLLIKNDKKYARITFIVGLDHKESDKNLKLAYKLDELLNHEINGITRGVMKKTGNNVNGIYNEDISPNSLLIEIGGKENTISEITNTVKVLSNVLYNYIKDNK